MTEEVFSQVVMFEQISEDAIKLCTTDGFSSVIKLRSAKFKNPYDIRHLFGATLRWIMVEVLEEEDAFIGYVSFSFEQSGRFKEVNLDFVGVDHEDSEIEFFRTVWHPHKVTPPVQ